MVPKSLHKKAEDPSCRVIVFLGGVDTGKTTLVWELAAELSKSCTVGVVDSDIGQSHLGPPTTVGWGIVPPDAGSWEDVEVRGIYFVGALSPQGHLLPTVVGTKLLCDEARSLCDKVLVDTTGLIWGDVGRILKSTKVDVLDPDLVVGMQKGRELEPILNLWKGMLRPQVLKFQTSPEVRSKTWEMRYTYREEQFRRYFQDARLISIRWREVGIYHLSPERLAESGDRQKGRIVSLRDRKGKDRALGAVYEVDPRGVLTVWTPLGDDVEIGGVLFGEVWLPEGILS